MKRIMIFFVVVLLLCHLDLFSQTLDGILAKNYESRGGLEKLKSLNSIQIKGKITQSMMNMEMPLKLWYKKPDKMRMESEFQGRKIVQGYDGQTAWWIMPFLGTEEPQKMSEEQSKEVVDMVESMDPLVDYKEKGYKLEYLGQEDLEGTEVYKLKMTRKENREEFYYLECDSGITLKTASYVKKGENDILVETIYGDYQEVDGVMMAFHMEVRTNSQTTVTMTFEEFKFNEEMADSMFVMPRSEKSKTTGE